jgi:hypothetical protein
MNKHLKKLWRGPALLNLDNARNSMQNPKIKKKTEIKIKILLILVVEDPISYNTIEYIKAAKLNSKHRGLSQRANYTDRATAACRRS